MNLIKNAHVYRINLPAMDVLASHLQELVHREILPTEASGAGFVPVHQFELVAEFNGGYAFAVRYDEKLLPASVVNEEARRRVADIELHSGARMTKVERQAVKEQVVVDLLAKSHVRSKTIQVFYCQDKRLLIVPVSSKNLAALIAGLLVRAVGAAKTETINVADVKGGLTARMRRHLDDEDNAFDGFELSPDVWLQGEGGKVTYQIDSVDAGHRGLQEALDAGFKVTAVRLDFAGVSFKLTSDFFLRGIRFESEDGEAEFDSRIQQWEHTAAVQVFAVAKVIDALCELFDYKAPDDAEESQGVNNGLE